MATLTAGAGGGLSPTPTVDFETLLRQAKSGYSFQALVNSLPPGVTADWLAGALRASGMNILQGGQGGYTIAPTSAAGGGVAVNTNSPAPKGKSSGTQTGAPTTTPTTPVDPNASQGLLSNPNATTTTTPYDPYANGIITSSGVTADTAANIAEKQREFDITTARDVAKQEGTEVDALQQRLAALSGPKDAYADYFFAHGLLPPQGYKPAPVPMTQAQIDAYGRMGVTPQQLQQMVAGTGQPSANFGMLGSLGSSLQTPAGLPQVQQGAAPTGAQGPSNPTVQGGALYNVNPTVPGTGGTPNVVTPGGVTAHAAGGQVPGPQGMPTLAVLHGGEQVTPANQNPNNTSSQSLPPTGPGGGVMNIPGLHPAIAALVDAVSNLLSNPDFAPFVQAAQTNQPSPSGLPQQGAAPGIQGSTPPGSLPQQRMTPGGVQGLASGGTVMPGGVGPIGGMQGMVANTASPLFQDNPIMPISNMDPYTRALYDMNGRLHPYSAQQQAQMGPGGVDAVTSYVTKVQGGDMKQYQDLADRLKPMSGAPEAGDVQSEGFTTG